jgi:hypothetical protein
MLILRTACFAQLAGSNTHASSLEVQAALVWHFVGETTLIECECFFDLSQFLARDGDTRLYTKRQAR